MSIPNGILKRLESGDEGTFGRLSLAGWTCLTGELPWRDNARGRSCIPAGTYKTVMMYSPKFRRPVYRLLGTEPRGGILIHAATWMGDVDLGWRSHLQGCIALGEKLGWMEGQKALFLSRPAVSRLEVLMQGSPFTLEIQDA